MYQTSEIATENLKTLEVKHQAKIIALTGQQFEPVKGFLEIQKLSENFKKPHPKAEEADALLIKLLAKDGLIKKTVQPKPAGIGLSEQERITMEAEARKRALKLVALKLKMKAVA